MAMIAIRYHASKLIAAQMMTYKRIWENCQILYFKHKVRHLVFGSNCSGFVLFKIHFFYNSGVGDKTDKTARIQRRYSTKPQKSVKSGFDETTDLTSSSEIMVSTSASDHDSASEQNGGANESGETSGSDESENSGSSKGDSDNTEAQYYRRLLTEEAVKMHELYFPPMSTYDRISYWKLADECSEIEDDFDETLYASQPLRSERVSLFIFPP